MAAVIADEAVKAAVLDTDMIHMSVPIEKAEDTEDINPVDGTPDIVIAGKCTDGTLDSDLQVVDPEASLRWVKTWYDTKANIRMQHDPKRPVGKGIEVDGHYLKALIADPTAKHLIRQKVLQDFSIGIMHPDIRKGDPRFKHLDPMGKAVNGIITDRTDGLTGLGEISVVDRGSNFGSAFSLIKAAADGTPEWVGKMVGGDVVTKDARPARKPPKTVDVTLPANMSLSIKPSDLAKLANLKRGLEAQRQRPVLSVAEAIEKSGREPRPAEAKFVGEHGPELQPVPAGAEVMAPDVAKMLRTEAGVYKRDIDTAARERLLSQGRALPGNPPSYPVETHEDADNAVTLLLSGHGDVKAARRLVTRIARKEGWKDILDRLKGGKGKAAEPDVTKPPKGKKAKAEKRFITRDEAIAAWEASPEAQAGMTAEEALRAHVAAQEAKLTGKGKKGKLRAVCPQCGAKQNPDHKHCPECGHALPARPLMTTKNHDHICLGCGKELDKGERFCPGCGKQNPGYLPEADRKIPANQDKTATAAGKGRGRAEKGKNSGKPRGRTPASASGAIAPPQKPVGPHREPDGPAVEAFEAGAHMEDGDTEKTATVAPKAAKPKPAKKAKGKKKGPKKLPPWLKDKDGDGDGDSDGDDGAEKAASPLADPPLAASLRLKALNVPAHIGMVHDFTCPAYAPEAVKACYPDADLPTLDLSAWQATALEKAAGGSFEEARQAQDLLAATNVLRAADPFDLFDLREGAHKMFRDANPGPASFPHPGQISPQRYNRPYLSEGHAAPSPGQEGPNHARIPEPGGIQPTAYQRGYLDAGHADDSPANTGNPAPMPVPSHTGMPTSGPARTYYRNSARESAAHAMRLMHDHIQQTFPDLCTMHASENFASHPVPTPEGVPDVIPIPGARGLGKPATKAERKAQRAAKAAKAAKRKAAKARKVARVKQARIAQRVLKGSLSLEDAQAKLGITAQAAKAAEALPQAPEPPVVTPLTAGDLAAAAKAATAPLLKRIARQDKALRKQGKVLDAIAGQPDTTGAPFRGVALPKQASAAPAGPPAVAKSAEQAQAALLASLYDDWRNDPNPANRKAAWDEIYARTMDPNMTRTPT